MPKYGARCGGGGEGEGGGGEGEGGGGEGEGSDGGQAAAIQPVEGHVSSPGSEYLADVEVYFVAQSASDEQSFEFHLHPFDCP